MVPYAQGLGGYGKQSGRGKKERPCVRWRPIADLTDGTTEHTPYDLGSGGGK